MIDHGAIAGHIDCPQCQDDRDRAVLARIGGHVMRAKYAQGWAAETLAEAVSIIQRNRKSSRRAYLPESAFDWPIYQAATDDRRDDVLRGRAADRHLSGWLAQVMADDLAAIHENGGHTGDVYVEGCPTCESWGQDGSGVAVDGIEQYQRESR